MFVLGGQPLNLSQPAYTEAESRQETRDLGVWVGWGGTWPRLVWFLKLPASKISTLARSGCSSEIPGPHRLSGCITPRFVQVRGHILYFAGPG